MLSRLHETRDGNGNLVHFYQEHDKWDLTEEEQRDLDEFKRLLGKMKDVRFPVDHKVEIAHGGFGRYSRYDVRQHRYAGGGSGYIEVLEVKDPPEGRCGIIVNEHRAGMTSFTKWKELESAIAAFEKYWGSDNTIAEFPKLPGFIRRVPSSALAPWFYATGNETLVGEHVMPCGLSDDQVFKIGNYFVVEQAKGLPVLKMCVGCRFVKRERQYGGSYYQVPEKFYRIVYFDDGTCWEEGDDNSQPRLAQDGELWVTMAVAQFQQALAGKQTGFEIMFTGGEKFVGKIVPWSGSKYCAEGTYHVKVQLEGEQKPLEGGVEFSPTPDCPDVVTMVTKRFESKGKKVQSMEVESRNIVPKGKKWSGVFVKPS